MNICKLNSSLCHDLSPSITLNYYFVIILKATFYDVNKKYKKNFVSGMWLELIKCHKKEKKNGLLYHDYQ